MIQELACSLVLLILKINGSTTVLKMNESTENSSSLLMSEVNHKKCPLKLTVDFHFYMFISFLNVSQAVHYAFLACLHAILYCEAIHVDQKCAACVIDALVKVYEMDQ